MEKSYPFTGVYFEKITQHKTVCNPVVFTSLLHELDFVEKCGVDVVAVYGLRQTYMVDKPAYQEMIKDSERKYKDMTTNLETYIRTEIESLNKDITPLQDLFSNVACTRELKSIYISTKRMSGKTSLINKLMCEFGSSIVFTQTYGITCGYHPFLKGRVFNIRDLDSDHFLRGLAKEPFFPLQYVFTDECKLSNEQIERLYMMRAIDRKTIFIGLGTDYK